MIYFLFDFDKTLFNSLDPNEIKFLSGINIFGYEDPNSVPLNRNFISGLPIGNIGESWNEDIVNIAKKQFKNSKKFLVTGRPRNKEFMLTVIEFLKNKGLEFDGYYFGYDHLNFERSKHQALEKIISKFGKPTKVYFFDDNKKFVSDFKNYFLINIPDFKLIINNITNGKLADQNIILERRYNKPRKGMKRRWSVKYKKKINCNRPKGFSQKQYCKRKKRSGKYLGEIMNNIDIKILIRKIIAEEINHLNEKVESTQKFEPPAGAKITQRFDPPSGASKTTQKFEPPAGAKLDGISQGQYLIIHSIVEKGDDFEFEIEGKGDKKRSKVNTEQFINETDMEGTDPGDSIKDMKKAIDNLDEIVNSEFIDLFLDSIDIVEKLPSSGEEFKIDSNDIDSSAYSGLKEIMESSPEKLINFIKTINKLTDIHTNYLIEFDISSSSFVRDFFSDLKSFKESVKSYAGLDLNIRKDIFKKMLQIFSKQHTEGLNFEKIKKISNFMKSLDSEYFKMLYDKLGTKKKLLGLEYGIENLIEKLKLDRETTKEFNLVLQTLKNTVPFFLKIESKIQDIEERIEKIKNFKILTIKNESLRRKYTNKLLNEYYKFHAKKLIKYQNRF